MLAKPPLGGHLRGRQAAVAAVTDSLELVKVVTPVLVASPRKVDNVTYVFLVLRMAGVWVVRGFCHPEVALVKS